MPLPRNVILTLPCTQNKRQLIVFGVLVVCIYLVFWYLHKDTREEYLVVSHNNATKNGGPLTIIDLTTGEERRPNIPSIGCGGVTRDEKNPNTGLSIYCVDSKTETNLWDISLIDDMSVKPKVLPHPFEAMSVPVHAKILVDTEGRQYYNAGGPRFGVDGSLTDAGVVLVKGNEVSKIPISDQSKPYFILRMVQDEAEGKLWVMSTMTNDNVLIDRIDIQEKKVDFSYTIASYSGFEMVKSGEEIAIGTYRTNEGTDITILDKYTGAVKKEITIPGKDEGFNALGMLPYGDKLLVGSTGGIYRYDTENYEVEEFIPNNPNGQFTYLVRGKDVLYGIDSYDRVLVIPEKDMLHPKVIFEAEGQGLTNLYYFTTK